MIATQTRALFIDAYRDLNSRKLFWIVLVLNVVVVAGFSALGVKGDRISIITWEIPHDIPVAMFVYKWIFSFVVVGQWLTWMATILALISTASIFPDFLAGGAVDLYLCRPIGRVRLFLTKYLTGLLFVTLQVTVFTTGSFLVLGWRGQVWQPGLFIAIPVVVLFFSYLFSICVFFGIWTRSTLAAFFLTLIVWGLIFGLNAADRFLVQADELYADRAARAQQRIAAVDKSIAAVQARLDRAAAATMPAARPNAASRAPTPQQIEADNATLRRLRFDRNRLVTTAAQECPPDWVKTAQPIIFGINTVVPKTQETVGLLDRVLFDDVALKATLSALPEGHRTETWREQIYRMLNARSVWWILGSSIAFEALVLTLAIRRFCRGDY